MRAGVAQNSSNLCLAVYSSGQDVDRCAGYGPAGRTSQKFADCICPLQHVVCSHLAMRISFKLDIETMVHTMRSAVPRTQEFPLGQRNTITTSKASFQKAGKPEAGGTELALFAAAPRISGQISLSGFAFHWRNMPCTVPLVPFSSAAVSSKAKSASWICTVAALSPMFPGDLLVSDWSPFAHQPATTSSKSGLRAATKWWGCRTPPPSCRREQADSYLADVQVDELCVLVRHVTPKISTDETVPPVHIHTHA